MALLCDHPRLRQSAQIDNKLFLNLYLASRQKELYLQPKQGEQKASWRN
jgi:hypothetical protein